MDVLVGSTDAAGRLRDPLTSWIRALEATVGPATHAPVVQSSSFPVIFPEIT